MSDVTTPAAGAQPTGSAGRLLQAGRERRGLELDALAQLLKVPVRKLQALEADRFEELPGAAFTRSLAQSYARQVGVDVQEVLALLPQAIVPPQRLEHVSRGLQTPYREGSGAHFGGGSGFDGFRPVHGIALALLALALLLWLMPPLSTLLPSLGLSSGSEPAAEVAAGSEAAASSTVVVETIHGTPGEQVVTPVPPAAPAASAALVAPVPVPASAPPVAPAASAPVPAPATPAGTVVLKTRAASWIEVRDAGNAVLLSRTLQSGETVGLDGAMPMRVRVGVASALELSLRGEPVDLKPYTRGTSATVVLK
ncbi:helix-turn-helix domain-containing protein [Sphaerotilus natans]|uniref:helix-turn-helix domain-containing protein n=1 Tax=Sphaerotilus natans TaxID=34103 RepID=UPI00406CE228